MATITVRYCDIPEYLRKGEFFRSLSEDDPKGSLQIPADCFTNNGKIAKNLQQFTQLLRVMVYWMLDEIPFGVVDFCNRNDIEVWREAVLNLPGRDQSSLVTGLLGAFRVKDGIHFDYALKSNDWEVINHCINMVDPGSQDARKCVGIAAQQGNLPTLKLLYEKRFQWDNDTCVFASRNGHLECLQFAHDNGCPWDVRVYKQALKDGHMNCIQYAHQQGLMWDDEVCRYASHFGQKECLQYLLENECPVDSGSCLSASRHGHTHCLQLLHQYNVPWDAETCSLAARCVDISCLEYLHDNNCPWDKRTPFNAALYGQIKTLQYALEHNCNYNENIIQGATCGGNIKCLEYLIEDQLLYMDENGSVFITALLKGNLQCLQYLIDQGCPYHKAQFFASDSDIANYDKLFTKNNPEFVQCLQYAVERGWCIDQNCIDYLVSRDWDNCREYLTQEGYVTPHKEKSVPNMCVMC